MIARVASSLLDFSSILGENRLDSARIERLEPDERQSRAHEALGAAGVGTWEWDVANIKIYWSDEVYDVHGISREVVGDSLNENMTHLLNGINLGGLMCSPRCSTSRTSTATPSSCAMLPWTSPSRSGK